MSKINKRLLISYVALTFSPSGPYHIQLCFINEKQKGIQKGCKHNEDHAKTINECGNSLWKRKAHMQKPKWILCQT